MTKTLYLNTTSKGHIERAAQILLDGGLVAFPTETVYGLGALALNPKSVEKVFKAKNRPASNPLIVHVSAPEQAELLFDFQGSSFSQQFLTRFNLLSDSFWPGPLTIVGKKAEFVSDFVTATSTKVAVRIPSHPGAQSLLKALAKPLVAPSANLFTRPSPTALSHVRVNLDSRIDAALDGGSSEFGIESTVIDIDREIPRILRHGAISRADLESVLG